MQARSPASAPLTTQKWRTDHSLQFRRAVSEIVSEDMKNYFEVRLCGNADRVAEGQRRAGMLQ